MDKELVNSQPKPRTSKTYQSVLFQSPQPTSQKIRPTSISNVFSTEPPIIGKVRQSPSHHSNVFEGEQLSPRQGIKTYQSPPRQEVSPQPKRRFLAKKDTPVEHFYHQEKSPMTAMKTPQPTEHETTHLYRTKDENYVAMTTFERRLADDQSNIFNLENKKTNTTHTLQFKQPQNKSYTMVNEFAVFDKDFSKKKKLVEAQSSLVDNQPQPTSIIKTKEDEPNSEIKRRNQNFSDIFDLEYGPKSARAQKMHSMSPSTMKWTDHDSVRNKQIAGDAPNNTTTTVINTKFGHSRLSSNHIQCSTLNKALKGELRQDSSQVAVESSNQYRSNQGVVFSGLYSWKNNYKKRK